MKPRPERAKLRDVLRRYMRKPRRDCEFERLLDRIIKLYCSPVYNIENKTVKNMQNIEVKWFINKFCEVTEIDIDFLKGKSRKQRIAVPRQVLIYNISKNWQMDLKRIGEIFGNRDHSTIYYSIGKCEDNFKTKFPDAIIYNNICKKIIAGKPDYETIKNLMKNEK